ncbi:MAG: GntR family transcriptional regulator [Acidimicrobiia bacterium]
MTCVYTAGYTDQLSRGELVFTELKARLLAGEFPIGGRLGEERIAGLLDVSRTPVREALHRLHSEGFVQRHVDGGFTPVVPDVVVMRQLYEVRVCLEVQALRRPGELGTRHDTAALEVLLEEWRARAHTDVTAGTDFVLVDESFHLGLAAAAGNAVLVDVLRSVNERIRIVRMQDFTTEDRIHETVAQHLGIVEAVLTAGIDTAVARFEDHLAESLRVVEQRTLMAIARMSSPEARSA